METKNIMIVGVGGQGTLLTSRILGGLALEAGYDVKLSEVHGMAQRGGSVVTYVRFGDSELQREVEIVLGPHTSLVEGLHEVVRPQVYRRSLRVREYIPQLRRHVLTSPSLRYI